MAYMYEKFLFLEEDFFKCIRDYYCDPYESAVLFDFFLDDSSHLLVPFTRDLMIEKKYLFEVAPLCERFLDDRGEAPNGWDKETCFKVVFVAHTIAEFMCCHAIGLEDLDCGYFKRKETEVV